MKKITLLLILKLLSFNLYAINISAEYTITYGSLMELGIANATLKIDNDSYKITIEAKTTGMARLLTNNRVEVYESIGKVINNEFVPNKFIKTKRNDFKSRIREYSFDYLKKEILVKTIDDEKKKVLGENFKYNIKDQHSQSDDKLEFFAKDDLLSLFFNLNKKILNFRPNKEYSLKAVGANKKSGEIDILIPIDNKLIELETLLNKDNQIKFIAYINQNIFGSDKGELFISINNEGFCTKAVLKDVLLFGDIVGEMTNFKVE